MPSTNEDRSSCPGCSTSNSLSANDQREQLKTAPGIKSFVTHAGDLEKASSYWHGLSQPFPSQRPESEPAGGGLLCLGFYISL